jgi:hypothetical protein
MAQGGSAQRNPPSDALGKWKWRIGGIRLTPVLPHASAAKPPQRRDKGGIARLSGLATPMFRDPVSSSMTAAIGYSEDNAVLEVEFVSGALYRYLGVGPDMYEKLCAAHSVGRYFNEHIKDAYPWECVER